MAIPKPPYLTKSRYVAGLQCDKRLWMQVHDPLPADQRKTSPMMEWGTFVGEKARTLFPKGALVEAKPWERSEAVARTAALMADRNISAIFEAAFEADGVHVRVDILERLKGAWGVREIKLSTEVKDEHLDDAAIQVHVLRAAGIKVPSVEIWHINREYERGAREVDWKKYFRRVDVTEEILSAIDQVSTRLKMFKTILGRRAAPTIEPGSHCFAPYGCEFWDRCTDGKPHDWVFHLPRVSAAQLAELARLEIERVAHIPAQVRLTESQLPIVTAHRTGRPHISSELAVALVPLDGPACYLDFEAMSSPVPAYQATRPYQRIPFQWSLHVRSSDGQLAHSGFLADAGRDPRQELAGALLDALDRTRGPIVVYSSYERSVLGAMKSTASKAEARQIDAVIGRIIDLLPIVRRNLYLPEFSFSYSIKSVAPALAPEFTYDDLDEVSDGNDAAHVFELMALGMISDREEIARLRAALERYCQRDTLAMIVVHDALRALAKNPG